MLRPFATPLGVALVVNLMPADILAAARERAAHTAQRPVSRIAAAVIVAVWGGVGRC